MVVEIFARIRLVLSELKVWVGAARLGSATREMFHRDLNAAVIQLFALNALNESRGNLAHEVGVLREGLGNAEPPGFGRKIEAVSIHTANAESYPLFCDRLGEHADEVHVARCR